METYKIYSVYVEFCEDCHVESTEYSLYESLCVFALLSSTTKAGLPCPSCTRRGARPVQVIGSCGRAECLHVKPAAVWWGATACLPPAQWSAVPTTPTSQRSLTAAKTWLPPRSVTSMCLTTGNVNLTTSWCQSPPLVWPLVWMIPHKWKIPKRLIETVECIHSRLTVMVNFDLFFWIKVVLLY